MLALQRYIRGDMKKDLEQPRKQGQKARRYDICRHKFNWVRSDRLSWWLILYDRYHVSEMHETMLKLPVDQIPNVWRVKHCGLKEKSRGKHFACPAAIKKLWDEEVAALQQGVSRVTALTHRPRRNSTACICPI